MINSWHKFNKYVDDGNLFKCGVENGKGGWWFIKLF